MAAPSDDLPLLAAVRAALSPAEFSRLHFGWDPYPYQEQVMNTVLVDGKKRVAWVAGRRVGKTLTIANTALQLAIKRPGVRIANFAPTFRQATILSRQIKFWLDGSEFRKSVVMDNLTELRLRLRSDARGRPVESVILTNSMSGNVRGEGADVLIADESAFCKSEDYRNKALPYIANKPDAVIIHISTVWAEDDHFMEAVNHYATLPNGAVFRTPTRMNPTVTPEMLAELRASMRDAEFRREYECDLTAEGGVFDRRALAACMQDYELLGLDKLDQLQPKKHHRYYVGVDWAKMQDRSVIAVLEQGTQDKVNPARLVFLQTYEPDPTSHNHYTRNLDAILRVAKQVDAERVTVDATRDEGEAERLHRALGGRVREFRYTPDSRNRLVGDARLLVERRGIVLPVEPDEVRRAFANVQATEKGYEHASRRTKDVFDAITLALDGVKAGDEPEARPPMRIATAEPGHRSGDIITTKLPGPPDELETMFGRDILRRYR